MPSNEHLQLRIFKTDKNDTDLDLGAADRADLVLDPATEATLLVKSLPLVDYRFGSIVVGAGGRNYTFSLEEKLDLVNFSLTKKVVRVALDLENLVYEPSIYRSFRHESRIKILNQEATEQTFTVFVSYIFRPEILF